MHSLRRVSNPVRCTVPPFPRLQSEEVLLPVRPPGYDEGWLLSSALSVRQTQNKRNLWPESGNELRRPSDRRLSAKLVPTFADRGCHVVSVTDPHGRSLGFLDREADTELSNI
jgi:hypothetical protein